MKTPPVSREPKSAGEGGFPESPIALQKPSQGGLLATKERSGWEWFIFLITSEKEVLAAKPYFIRRVNKGGKS